MRLLTVKEAAAITGLKECELRLGAKQGRYPHIRTGNGGAKAPYLFDIDLLNKAIKNLAEQNMKEAKAAFEEDMAKMPNKPKRYVAGSTYRSHERSRPLTEIDIERRKRLYVAE